MTLLRHHAAGSAAPASPSDQGLLNRGYPLRTTRGRYFLKHRRGHTEPPHSASPTSDDPTSDDPTDTFALIDDLLARVDRHRPAEAAD